MPTTAPTYFDELMATLTASSQAFVSAYTQSIIAEINSAPVQAAPQPKPAGITYTTVAMIAALCGIVYFVVKK